MNKKSKITFAVVLLILCYLGSAFLLVKDYGVTWDEPENFGIGHKYLYFYQSGHLDYTDQQPYLGNNHPDFYTDNVKHYPYLVWPFVNLLSAGTCLIFYQKMHLLGPIPAHHIVIPILTTIFLWVLWLFVNKHFGPWVGLISILAFITYPRLFGHSFNNIKDVPELILFSITLILFAEWVLSKELKYLYGAFICWGLALATKADAVFVPIILFLWLMPHLYRKIRTDSSIRIRLLLWFILGFLLTCLTVAVLWPPFIPYYYANNREFFKNAPLFLYNHLKYVGIVGTNTAVSWNLYAPEQIFYVTPPVMLFLFFFGFSWLIVNLNKNKLYLLLVTWVLFPVVRHCLPYTNHYTGIRHFLVFIVPFSIILGIGINELAGLSSKRTWIFKKGALIILILLFVTPNIYTLITLHPYQTTYFSPLIGGLKGAQKKDIPYACDYWLNSYQEAAKWLEKHGVNNAYYYAHPNPSLFQYYISRKDLVSISPEEVLSGKGLSHTYLIVVPTKYWNRTEEILQVARQGKVVYQVKRQGGEVITIYYFGQT